MIVYSLQNGYRPGVLALFDNPIEFILTVVQVGVMDGEQAGVKLRAVKDTYTLAYRCLTSKRLQKTEKDRGSARNKFMGSNVGRIDAWEQFSK